MREKHNLSTAMLIIVTLPVLVYVLFNGYNWLFFNGTVDGDKMFAAITIMVISLILNLFVFTVELDT